MILKTFELEKKITKKKFIYSMGKMRVKKKEIIEKKFLENFKENTFKYNEKEVLANLENFFDKIFILNLFLKKRKIIIISDVSDRIKNEIEKILEKNLVILL